MRLVVSCLRCARSGPNRTHRHAIIINAIIAFRKVLKTPECVHTKSVLDLHEKNQGGVKSLITSRQLFPRYYSLTELLPFGNGFLRSAVTLMKSDINIIY